MLRSFRLFLCGAGLLILPTAGFAQLLDQTLVDENGNVDAPLGIIPRSLEDQIGAGHGDVVTPNSAVFIIKRDPARAIRRGRQLFQRKFSAAEGQGPRVNFTSTGDVTQNRALGAGLADSCAACHGRPRGSAGFGGDVATRPDSRDAPMLFGLGLDEQLADEMTAELRAIRTQAISQASGGGSGVSCSIVNTHTWDGDTYQADVQVVNNSSTTTNGWSVTLNFNQPANIFNSWEAAIINGNTATVTASNLSHNANLSPGGGSIQFGVQGNFSGTFTPPTCTGSGGGGGGNPVMLALTAKGMNFGSITAFPDGSVDTSQVDGVNPDLRIRPFFHDGATVTIREFINGAFDDEMGLQAFDPVLCAVTDPVNPQIMVSPSGFVFNPALDDFERPRVCNPGQDVDGDGITNEIDPALVDHMEFYLLNYFNPGQDQVTARAQQGRQLMTNIGCTGCHVPTLTINNDRRVANVDTNFDPFNGIFNDLFAVATTLFHMESDGTGFPPLLLPNENTFVVENFFSDLKRHDLGPFFHERNYDGTLQTEFVTEPLGGVSTSAPYGHDGRSVTLDNVIRRHGGEALQARLAYEALSADSRRMIREFLQTLVLFPPDDTASNLNPGNPNTNNPQVPAEHGSIDLSTLFVLPLGPE
jgi:hypothetical protein